MQLLLQRFHGLHPGLALCVQLLQRCVIAQAQRKLALHAQQLVFPAVQLRK
ncbi:hypothetical protein D3C81_1906730 [compost metagenome]